MQKQIELLKNMDNTDLAFDLIIANAYFCGQFGKNCPVEESREVFDSIKKRLQSN